MNLRFGLKLSLVFVLVVAFQGCASNPYKSLDREKFGSATSVKVARYEPAKLRKPSTGSKVAAVAAYPLSLVFLGLPAGAAAATTLGIEAKNGAELLERAKLPDYSEIIMTKFVKAVQAEMPEWPKCSIDKEFFTDDRKEGGYHIVFRVFRARASPASGLLMDTDAEMFAPDQTRIWGRRFYYSSADFERCTDLAKLEADEGKLLHEEWQYAADQTVAYFISHLKEER
jgi:hypothetical protein